MKNEPIINWKECDNKTHSMQYLCSRVCSFPPALPRFLIDKYSRQGDIVFDPWSGKGTTAFEALLKGRIGIGNDISPDAFILTYAKVNPVPSNRLKNFLDKLSITPSSKNNLPLSELDKKARVYYNKKTFQQILALKDRLKNDFSDEAIFTKAIVLGILHGNSSTALSLNCSHSYSMSPNYVQNYAKKHDLHRPSKNVLDEIFKRAQRILKDPLPTIKGRALNNNSESISLDNNSVDLIIGSPPYFNIQTYAWCNWLRLWFLGYDYRDVKKRICESGSKVIYSNFMKNSMKEIYRILKPNGYCFIIAGDVTLRNKRKEKVNTINFLRPIFEHTGFTIETVFVDKVPRTKRVLSYIPKDKGVKVERIAMLRK